MGIVLFQIIILIGWTRYAKSLIGKSEFVFSVHKEVFKINKEFAPKCLHYVKPILS